MPSSSTALSRATVAPEPDRPADILTEIAHGVGANGEVLSLSIDLLRRVIELLLPRAAGDGPSLTELLAALLANLRELLIVSRSSAKNIEEILQRLDAAGLIVPQGSLQADGSRRG